MAGLATAYQDDTHFYVENDLLQIAVLRSTGNLDGIVHKQSGINLQTVTTNYYPDTWAIAMVSAAGSNLYVQSNQAMSFNGTIQTSSNGASLNLTWNGLPGIPGLTVNAQIRVNTDSELSYWTIQASGLGTNVVSSIDFPDVMGIGPLSQTGAEDLLLTPSFKGMLYHNPTANVPAGIYPGGIYPSGGGLTQFIAYFNANAGFYFACDDTQGYAKDLYWGKSPSPAGDYNINVAYLPPGVTSDTVSVPYNVIVGATQGDWYAPAEMYRTWAAQQSWVQQSLTKQVPEWLQNLALIRGACAHLCVVPPDHTYAELVQQWQQSDQTFGVQGLRELSGYEQFGQFVWGDYFPPQEGFASFDAMIQSTPAAPYFIEPSSLYLDTGTNLYKSGTMAPSAMLDQTGQALTTPGVAALPNDTWALMDVSTDPWRQYIIGVYQTLAQNGVDLMSFDSSMVMGPLPCYNPAHSHTPGMGGNWLTQAWIALIQAAAAAVAPINPQAAFSAEEPAEIYLPYLAVHVGSGVDQFEQSNQFVSYAEPVPLYQYLYHDSILFKDFVGPPVLDGSYFQLALARDLTWGQIPDYQIPNGYTPPLEPMAEAYLMNDIAARTTYAKKFLTNGVMVPAPPLNVPMTTVSWIDFSNNTQLSGQYPSIFESAWQAGDGSLGIILTNIAPESVTFSLPIGFQRLGLMTGSAYTVQTTDGSATATLDFNLTQDSTYSVTVAPQHILLVTIANPKQVGHLHR